MQNNSRYDPLTINCDQDEDKDEPTSTSKVMKKTTNGDDKNDISWFCWENYGQNCIENRPHCPIEQHCEHQQNNNASTNDSCCSPTAVTHDATIARYHRIGLLSHNCYNEETTAATATRTTNNKIQQQYQHPQQTQAGVNVDHIDTTLSFQQRPITNYDKKRDQPQTSKKKRKSKPAAHEPRRPLSAYNFFFSEEKEFVVALLPDRHAASEDQDASGTTITSASSSTSVDVVRSAPLSDYDPKNISINAPPCDDTRSTILDQQLVLMQSTPALKEIHHHRNIDSSSSSSMLVVYDMDIAKIHDYLVDIERRTSAETLTALRLKVERQTQQTLLVHLEGDRKKKAHKKSHGKISFQKLASIIGMRWRGLTDEGKKRYFELAKEDQGRFRMQQESKQTKNANFEKIEHSNSVSRR